MAGRYEPIDSPDETTLFPYHDLTPPTVTTVARARQRIRHHLPETPLVRSEALSEALDADVLLKREDTLPTGAFKVRGGVNLVSSLDEEFSDAGLLAASTGNHGQSIAWAGREFDVPVTIGVPEEANAGKVDALEQLGAEVIQFGEDYDEAREHIEELATQREARYVHSGNEPKLLAGVGTAGLEILDKRPDVDRVFCPVGGGTAAAGYCLTLGAMTDTDIIGVQAAGAPAVYRAWQEETLEALDSVDTIAEGVATRVPFALPTEILQAGLSDFRLVSEDAIADAVARLFETDRIVMEGACATAVAAALQAGEELRGETVVLPISGRNIDREKFDRLLAESEY
ncbi:L-threonine ammonia-lyase [Haloarcula vallismortis]|uniref:Threonine dehydratase/pyridoxal-5'-phosphate-dependent protein beta subunit n=2 Tax=Haloarcula vallismortis TaxID=28442 RepID=M0JMB5_HALVA|nr:threonine/serine dehydratase [Haloarcula vallismortis]EMA10292.1 threonine dehydratase/pyridoxal-5'-phosphate-dependent protein beta subunit [Haloarcula vallismortis ATCC 29715]SDW89121.1 L-threonine ammonia-lyase [Haloarcula vallismortis]